MIPFSTGSQQGHNLQCYWWCSWEWSSKFTEIYYLMYLLQQEDQMSPLR